MNVIESAISLHGLIVALFVFGLAPGLALRVIVLAFEKDDPRRQELLAELYAVPRWERPFWVFEQIEVALCEGIWERVVWAATGRIIYRWKLDSGVKRNRQYPQTFMIPDPHEIAALEPGVSVKLMFDLHGVWGWRIWGERMWVTITHTTRRGFVGELSNSPVGIPRLCPGARVRFRGEHIIDILYDDDEDDCAA